MTDVDALIAQARAWCADKRPSGPAPVISALLAALETAREDTQRALDERDFQVAWAISAHDQRDQAIQRATTARAELGEAKAALAAVQRTISASAGDAEALTAIRALLPAPWEHEPWDDYGCLVDAVLALLGSAGEPASVTEPDPAVILAAIRDRCVDWHLNSSDPSYWGAARQIEALLGETPWSGTPCCMCQGTGRDFTYSEVDGTRDAGATVRVVRNVPTGRPCRACNGHGREPTALPPAPH